MTTPPSLPSRPRLQRRLLTRITILLLLCFVALSACDVTVEDVQKWEKTTEGLEKMREFVLTPKNTFEVKLEALHILIKRNESHVLPELLTNLNNTELREALITQLIPRLEAMLTTEGNHHFQTTAKDAARYLALQTIDPEKKKRLQQIMISWVNLGNYQCPDQSSGQVTTRDIIATLGPDALQIVEPELKKRLDDYSRWVENAAAQQQKLSAESLSNLTTKILGVLLDSQMVNTPEADDRVATLIDEFTRKRYPDVPEFVSFVFTAEGFEPLKEQGDGRVLKANKSTKLLDLAEFVLKTNPESYKFLYTELLKYIILWEYFPKIAATLPARDGKLPLNQASNTCLNIIQQQNAGVAFARWQCLMFLGRTRMNVKKEDRVNIIELGFESIPDDPALLHIPDDHPFTQTAPDSGLPNFSSYSFLVESIDNFCAMLGEFHNDSGKPLDMKDLGTRFVPMDQIRKYLNGKRTIEQIMAMRCLFLHGAKDDLVTLRAFNAEGVVPVDISAWRIESYSTLGELAEGIANAYDPPTEEPPPGETPPETPPEPPK